MPEPEDEDDFPNDYDGLDFDNIPGLEAPAINTPAVAVHLAVPRNNVLSTAASPVPSTGSSKVEEMDPSFFAAVDALEARALGEMHQGSQSSPRVEPVGRPTAGQSALSLELVDGRLNSDNATKTALDSPQGEDTGSPNQVHEFSMHSPELSSTNRKGKRKAEPQEEMNMRTILMGYETELTCPICCDLVVGAQVANPCGHTCCGECGYGWLAQNKCEPTCAVCRSSLSTRKPLLPNFSVDNFVRQHLQALAHSGFPEWQEKGYRTIEWNKRLESWKKHVAARAAKEKTRLRRRQTRYYQVEAYSPWLVDESMDDDEDAVVAHVTPRRGTRSRR